jgi:predicted nucleotidyltransferase
MGRMTMRIEKLDSYERVPISDATRTLLCDFAAGDVKRPLHRLDADWEKVFQGACRNGLLGLTHRYLKQREPQDYPPPEFRQRVQQAYRIRAIRMALMYRNIRQVLAQLAESGVDYMVVKGPALAYTVYPDPALRAFNDLDLVVRERDWAAMHRLLVKMGFEPEADLPQPPPKLVPQAVLYELKYWCPEAGLLVEVHYDDLLNAGLASRDVEGFWQRAILVDVEGVLVKALSLEDQLIHLCAHAHYHGYTRLNCFSDIAFIVRDQAAQLDWERLLETVRIEEAHVGVYYSLRFLDQLLGVGVPGDVLAALRPDRFRRWFHERYLPEEKVLSLQPMWRPDFSFYFIPLFKRLLPDLLVMGRRGDKLRYLLRLLFPPRTWLRDYYKLGHTSRITMHYLLHPLKLTYRYLAEVVTTVF